MASFFFVLVGIFIGVCAIRAPKFGVDLDGRWGPYRLLLAGAGAAMLLLGLLPGLAILWRRFFYDIWQSHLAGAWHASRSCRRLRAILATVKSWRPLAWWAENPARSGGISAVFLFTLCAVIYFWYATVGYGFDNSKFPSYYQMLADAFRHGQTALLVEPDPALAQLKNPYDFSQREHIHYLWDVSYYNGKYYLYWGPSPVLGQWLLEAISPLPIGDAYLMTFYAVILTGVLFGILFSIWRRFFSRASSGAFGLILIAVGFSNPILWLVSRPATYEISIIAGQFYLLAGLWAGLPLLLGDSTKTGRLILAGLGWALAVLARSTLAIPVIFLGIFCAWRLIHQKNNIWRRLFAVGIPLALGAGFLFFYNYIRFDSPFEFGIHYQLTSFSQFNDAEKMFQPRYIPINFFNYFFNPINVMPEFPFIEPIPATITFKGIGINAPDNYSGQWLSGLLISIPFLYFLSVIIAQIFCPKARAKLASPMRTLIGILCITALLELGMVHFFFSSSMRYAMDSIPTLLILAGMGAWSLLEWAQHAPHRVWVPWMLTVLVFLNAAIGLLLGFSGENRVFARLNPALFAQLSAWFRF
ncbi:hypothetical protein [Longilinea arvoryzae]|uniref:hypothetical protein n=1 Tax=Longilinea arvoryzae TaxID=360412 RepID=UPI0012601F80|nr:hypothetical protein [Longilinea arvoryzae]